MYLYEKEVNQAATKFTETNIQKKEHKKALIGFLKKIKEDWAPWKEGMKTEGNSGMTPSN